MGRPIPTVSSQQHIYFLLLVASSLIPKLRENNDNSFWFPVFYSSLAGVTDFLQGGELVFIVIVPVNKR